MIYFRQEIDEYFDIFVEYNRVFNVITSFDLDNGQIMSGIGHDICLLFIGMQND